MRGALVFAVAMLLTVLTAIAATPRRTVSTLRKAKVLTPVDTVVVLPEAPFDTITPATGAVRVLGFEKTIRARKESFFMTNNSADTLQSVCLDIEYRDMRGRQLHRRTHWLDAALPPGQTRRFDILAWDRQQTFYYRVHPRPRRRDAVPFDVSITVPAVTILRK